MSDCIVSSIHPVDGGGGGGVVFGLSVHLYEHFKCISHSYCCVVIDLQLDFSQQLDSQGPIDVILHKLTDSLNRSLDHGQEAMKWMDMLQVCL